MQTRETQTGLRAGTRGFRAGMRTRRQMLFLALAALALALFIIDMMTGSVNLTFGQVWDALHGNGDASTVTIVRHIRLIKAVVAMLVGAALAVSGLQMQTVFRNPLAGPYVLGITSGASLGVALAILGGLATGGLLSSFGIVGAAWIGSAAILLLIGAICVRIRDIMVILILGMMFSSGVGAVVQILQYLSHEEALKSFVVWTMGSLGDVTADQLWVLVPAVAAGLLIGVAVIKPLNLMMLGEQYAVTMGLNVRGWRNMIFLSTTLLAGTVTAFCGPIGFVGLAVPHIARALFADSDCRVLVPGSALVGILMMLVCDIISKTLVLPVNAITALMGIPVVVWIVLKNKNMAQ